MSVSGLKDPIISADLNRIKGAIDENAFHGKTVLVSGGSGFLGSWICDVLIESGSKVVCLDNLSTGAFENVEHLKGVKGFEFEKADVVTYSKSPSVDMVFHLASRPAPEDYQMHPVDTALANATGTDRMLELTRKNDALFYYASSSEIYGDPDVFPTLESYPGRVDSLGPRSCYEEGKRFGEALCKAYGDQYGLDVRIGRLFNSYGPRLRAEGFYGRVVSRFILQSLKGEEVTVYGDGSQTRSFCYVTDTVVGLLRQAYRQGLAGQAINIGSANETKIIELAKRIVETSKSNSQISFRPFPAGDHRRRLPNTAKALQDLDWKAEVSLEDGLRNTVQWFASRQSP